MVSDTDLRKLLAACATDSFGDRRDAAIICLSFDTGIRRATFLVRVRRPIRTDDVQVS